MNKELKEFYGAVSFSGRASFTIESENIESAEKSVFEDIEGIELVLKDGTKLKISEIDWDLISSARTGNVSTYNVDDFEIQEEED